MRTHFLKLRKSVIFGEITNNINGGFFLYHSAFLRLSATQSLYLQPRKKDLLYECLYQPKKANIFANGYTSLILIKFENDAQMLKNRFKPKLFTE